MIFRSGVLRGLRQENAHDHLSQLMRKVFVFRKLSVGGAGADINVGKILQNIFEIIMLLIIGIFAGFGQFFLTVAYKKAPVSAVSIYNYTGVIFSYLFSIFLFNEKVDIYSIIGMVIIIFAALLVYFYKNKITAKNN